MTVEDRNYLFEEKAYFVNVTMNKHYRLIRACRMDQDDVYQQLSLRLVTALDQYNPDRCPNMDAYLMLQLRYELLNMKPCSKRTGVVGAPKKDFMLISLDAREAAGYPAPASSAEDFSHVIHLEREIDRLPSEQRSALSRLLSGKRVNCRNKSLQAARLHIRNYLTLAERPQYA